MAERVYALKLFRIQHNGVRGTRATGSSAEDLAGIVDPGSIRDGEAGVGGYQRIEINKYTVTVDEAHVFAWPKWMVALNGKNRGTDDLALGVDSCR